MPRSLLAAGLLIYPGAIERTSFDERLETKGVVLLDCVAGENATVIRHRFIELPVRPMVAIEIPARKGQTVGWINTIRKAVEGLDPDSVVRIRITPPYDPESFAGLSEKMIREVVPKTMSVSTSYARGATSIQKPNS
jgi:DNA repair exonuclease SbcCD nuclease subunit